MIIDVDTFSSEIAVTSCAVSILKRVSCPLTERVMYHAVIDGCGSTVLRKVESNDWSCMSSDIHTFVKHWELKCPLFWRR